MVVWIHTLASEIKSLESIWDVETTGRFWQLFGFHRQGDLICNIYFFQFFPLYVNEWVPDCLVSLNFFETEGPNWQLSFRGKCKNPGWSFCSLRCWINSHTLTICVTVQTKGCFQGWGICSDSVEVWKLLKQKRKRSCYSNLQGNTRYSLDMRISEKLGEKILMAKGHWDLKARQVPKNCLREC